MLALELGKGVAMTGIPVKYKEYQGEPDYVVGREFGNQLKRHMTEVQKTFGLQEKLKRSMEPESAKCAQCGAVIVLGEGGYYIPRKQYFCEERTDKRLVRGTPRTKNQQY